MSRGSYHLCWSIFTRVRTQWGSESCLGQGTDNDAGQLGRIAVIGGSEDYAGAPYFSAMASARLGCDMVCLSGRIELAILTR